MSPPNYQYTSPNSQYIFTSVYSLCGRWAKSSWMICLEDADTYRNYLTIQQLPVTSFLLRYICYLFRHSLYQVYNKKDRRHFVLIPSSLEMKHWLSGKKISERKYKVQIRFSMAPLMNWQKQVVLSYTVLYPLLLSKWRKTFWTLCLPFHARSHHDNVNYKLCICGDVTNGQLRFYYAPDRMIGGIMFLSCLFVCLSVCLSVCFSVCCQL